MNRRYRFQRATVTVIDEGDGAAQYVRTEFTDGASCDGVPSFTGADFARAEELGYGSTKAAVWAMHRDHELLHTLLAEAAGLEWSPSLRYDVDGPPPRGVIPMEERVVFLLQRVLNHGRQVLDEREDR